ncbi:MAG: hypothetical protein MUF64_06955 [Polyangiaceae bacterium]|jgi:hypothetical protein|nr:hypothetical protein [Polyangiaceae bacterium]
MHQDHVARRASALRWKLAQILHDYCNHPLGHGERKQRDPHNPQAIRLGRRSSSDRFVRYDHEREDCVVRRGARSPKHPAWVSRCGPLDRLLGSFVGQPWALVEPELRAALRGRGPVRQALRKMMRVMRDEGGGRFSLVPAGLWIDERGLLCRPPQPERPAPGSMFPGREESPWRQYRFVDGVWYQVDLRRQSPRPSWGNDVLSPHFVIAWGLNCKPFLWAYGYRDRYAWRVTPLDEYQVRALRLGPLRFALPGGSAEQT